MRIGNDNGNITKQKNTMYRRRLPKTGEANR